MTARSEYRPIKTVLLAGFAQPRSQVHSGGSEAGRSPVSALVHIPATLRCPTPPSANELVLRVLLARPAGAAMWVPQLLLPWPRASQQLALWVMLLRECSWPTPRPSTGRLLLHRAVMCMTRRAGSALRHAARPWHVVVDVHRDGAPRPPREKDAHRAPTTAGHVGAVKVCSTKNTFQWPPAAFGHNRWLPYEPEHRAAPSRALGMTLILFCPHVVIIKS
jgi:hypothetical protein